ncbi:sulfotransferase 4A1-like [Mytilus trossulus]|uniref:sulfotransferase 4A1-like n=1 Tax=Mytilus trossulus TaxID=6551 RepID=UPI003005083D
MSFPVRVRVLTIWVCSSKSNMIENSLKTVLRLNIKHPVFMLHIRLTHSRRTFIHHKFCLFKFKSQTGSVTSVRTCSSNPSHGRFMRVLKAFVGTFCLGTVIVGLLASSKIKRRLAGIENVEDSAWNPIKHYIQFKGVVLPQFTENNAHKFENFEVRPDDVWVISFPRSETEWIQEIVFLINSNMDLEKAKTVSIDDRFPYLEYPSPGLDAIATIPSPRMIKTHLPLKLLPEEIRKSKVIYVARNPKDTVVSNYHFCKQLKTFDKNFNSFVKAFIRNKVGYAPWWQHVLEFWKIRDDPNVLFITYEDLCEDMEGSIRKISQFLNKELTNRDLDTLLSYCSPENMRNNKQVSYKWHLGEEDNEQSDIMKDGIGEWRKYFDDEPNYQINKLVAHKLANSGLTFKYDKEDKNDR